MAFWKPAALPSVRGSRSEPAALDSIHFRVPENWRRKVKSKRVRKWFRQFLEGKLSLSETDPGAGPLELSVRLPRGELKRAAQLFRIPGVSLLRRIIAPQVGDTHRPGVDLTTGQIAATHAAKRQPVPLAPVRSAGPTLGSEVHVERGVRKPLNIVTHVDGYRSLETIGDAIQGGEGITAEELIRWRAVHERK